MSHKIEISSYRGRTSLSDVLKILAVILAVLVILTGAFYALSREGGPLADVSLPFGTEEVPPETPAPTPAPTVDPTVAPTVAPETTAPETLPAPEPMDALVTVSVNTLLSANSNLSDMLSDGANGIVVDMKLDDGQLNWHSDAPLADTYFITPPSSTVNDSLKAILSEDVHAVARFSCFKDSSLGYEETMAIRTNSGYKWTDPEKIRWATPSNDAVHDYLIGRMLELCDLGFDEILLDNCGYPNRGNLGYIKVGETYNNTIRPVQMTKFLSAAREALAERDVTLSLRLPTSVLDGTDTYTGLTAEAISANIDRLWLSDAQMALLPTSEISSTLPPVLLTSAISTDYDGAQASFNLLNF